MDEDELEVYCSVVDEVQERNSQFDLPLFHMDKEGDDIEEVYVSSSSNKVR
jgi:hypothetical protein